jgi:hypothetical protein
MSQKITTAVRASCPTIDAVSRNNGIDNVRNVGVREKRRVLPVKEKHCPYSS